MKTVDWSDKVAADFRTRIIVDPHSPILAFKANRDRYTRQIQPSYEGLPYLGSQDSEDALTWNVFRSLQIARRLDIICDELEIGEPRGILFWTLAPETQGMSAELQYIAGTLIRKFDGILPGQVTEPDVIILGTKGLTIIECKLGERGKPLSHLWEGTSDSVGKRLPIYRQTEPTLLTEHMSDEQIVGIYQLVRMAFYALQLGKSFAMPPVVVSLVNETNWRLEIRRLHKSPGELWGLFCGALGIPDLKKKELSWQYLTRLITESPLVELHHYLSSHPCL